MQYQRATQRALNLMGSSPSAYHILYHFTRIQNVADSKQRTWCSCGSASKGKNCEPGRSGWAGGMTYDLSALNDEHAPSTPRPTRM